MLEACVPFVTKGSDGSFGDSSIAVRWTSRQCLGTRLVLNTTPALPSGGQIPEKPPQFGAGTPLVCPGRPGEIAPQFVLLGSAENSYTTGAVYGCTGGDGGA